MCACGVSWHCHFCETKAWGPSLSNGQVSKEWKWDLGGNTGHQGTDCKGWLWEVKGNKTSSLLNKKTQYFS